MRRFFKALMARQVTTKSCKSCARLLLSGAQVCSRVRVKGMLYWRRLLQTDILPQNESRRSLMVMFSMVEVDARFKSLIAFNVDIHLQASSTPTVGGATVPLWIK